MPNKPVQDSVESRDATLPASDAASDAASIAAGESQADAMAATLEPATHSESTTDGLGGLETLPATAEHETREIDPLGETVAPTEGSGLSASATSLAVVERERYTIFRELGRGGIGEVLEARDRRLARVVAIKQLRDADEGRRRARFLREALITARLQHPSIVPIYDAGLWPDGSPFYAMKKISGKTLRDLLGKTENLAERLAYLPHLIAVAEAVGYAHSKEILHRDLKPANVLVGEFGETVVVDWGLAKDLEGPEVMESPIGELGAAHGQTVVGTVMGTPGYMSPEQARGDHVGKPTDVYALGAMLYHLLSGQSPYRGESVKSMLEALQREAPTPLATVAPDAPPDLVAIADKAMARAPEDRYPTAKEMADDLTRFQAGQLVRAHAYTWGTLFKRWVRRHRAVLTVTAVLLLALVAVGAYSVHNVVRARDAAEHERARAEEEQRVAEAAREEAARRNDDLILVQARSLLDVDATRSLAWLAHLSPDAHNWPAARFVALDAVQHGIARHVLDEHRTSVYAAALSGDGKRLVTGDYFGDIILWDLDDGGQGRTVFRPPDDASSYQNGIAGLAINHAGDVIAASSMDGRLRIISANGEVLDTQRAVPFRLAFSPDDAALLLMDVRTSLYNLADRTLHPIADLPSNAVYGEFSADGRAVAIAATDGAIHLFDVQASVSPGAQPTAVPTATLGHPGVNLVAFSPDRTLLASAGSDDTVRIWRVTDATELHAVPHPGQVFSVSFSPTGAHAAIAGADSVVRVVDLQSGVIVQLGGHDDMVYRAEFSPDGRYLATAGGASDIRLWHADGRGSQVLRGHRGAVYNLLFTPDGSQLVSSSADTSARVWTVPSGALSDFRSRSEHEVNALAFAPDGRTLVAAGRDGRVRRWGLDDASHRILHRFDSSAADAVFSPDGRYVAMSGSAGSVRLHDTQTGTSRELGRHENVARHVIFSPGGDFVASAGYDGAVKLWATNGALLATLSGHEGEVLHLAFARDAHSLYTAGADGTVRRWDIEGGTHHTVIRHDADAQHVTVSPDGRSLASASADGTVRLHDLASDETRTSHEHTQHVAMVEFSPAGDRLASIGSDPFVVIWNLESDDKTRLVGHETQIHYLAFAPDGRTLATASSDGTVHLWDLASGQHHAVLSHLVAPAKRVAFSPDGRTLAAATNIGDIHIWSNTVPEDPAEILDWIARTTTLAVRPD